MKPHFKSLATVILAALIGGCMPALGAVPLRWNVETSRAQPASFDVYRGETLELHADMLSYGRPIETAGAVALYVQTNGMNDAWWTLPATVSSNRIEAVLAPTNYPGDAKTLNCFLGGPATSYRAAFRLRVLGAPGPAPETVQFPVRSLDFANVVVSNAPWESALTEHLAASNPHQITADEIGAIPSSTMWSFEWVGGGTGYGQLSLNEESGMKMLVIRTYPWDDSRPAGIIGDPDGGFGKEFALYWPYGWFGTIATSNMVESMVSPVASSVSTLSSTVNAWQTYWDGDDVRLTVTNYYGSVDMPHLYLEQKVSEGGTNYFQRVWDETTRHDAILERVHTIETNVAEKADRAWGHYDSHSGDYAPDDFTSISSPNVIIAPGMSYQKTVTTNGSAFWILTCTDPTVFSGTATNGFLRIKDGEGNALVEIVKGNKRTVGATAGGITVGTLNTVTITYNVASDEHPILEMCTDLAEGNWQVIPGQSGGATLGQESAHWTGESGAWVVTYSRLNPNPLPSAFFKATYEVGGETYIKNSAPISVDGGILCTDGVHKVRPVYNNGTITWQVVQ